MSGCVETDRQSRQRSDVSIQLTNRCFTQLQNSSFAERICTGYAESARFITTPSKKSEVSARVVDFLALAAGAD